MNSHVVHLDLVTHQTVQQLLPWLLAGTLDSAELALVQLHLQACTQCQADLEWQRKVRAAMPGPDPACDGERALARLLPRLTRQAPRNAMADWWRRTVAANSAWLRWSAVAQFGVIGALAILLARPGGEEGAYRALGSGARTEGNLVVVFKPDTAERELRRIVQAAGARVVDGPTASAAYVLQVPPAHAPDALARLRSEQAVTLAQPLAAGSRP